MHQDHHASPSHPCCSLQHIDTGLCEGPAQVVSMPWPAGCGAEDIFVGRTRTESHPEHGQLLHLEYEVYEPMALKVLEEMAREAGRRWGAQAVRIVHAVGAVGLGEASVIIQVATPHRSESFAACRYLIDRIKHELPIWKHEIWERGRTVVEGCCAHREGDAPPEAVKENLHSHGYHDHAH